MSRPLLRQYADLASQDFDDAPVWIGCHTADYDEPWYDDTDEETFRPFHGKLPANPEEGMLLVRAAISLNDGTRLSGFLTPALADEPEDGGRILGTQQPTIFTPARQIRLWFGGFEPSQDAIDQAYRALQRQASAVFPVRFAAPTGLVSGNAEGIARGFYWLEGFRRVKMRV
jgi:hypothetical protein